MNTFEQLSRMASYVLFKELYDDGKKDIYYILSQFIEDIIIERNLINFTSSELSKILNDIYGFSIPDMVIRSSLGRLDYVEKRNLEYITNKSLLPSKDATINEKLLEEKNINEYIFKELVKYISKTFGKLSEDSETKLINNFYLYLLDNNGNFEYGDKISAFIIEKKSDIKIYNQLTAIKQGAVLYAALNYNQSILPRSRWNDELFIFFETEILFHLSGYNGVLFKDLASEMLSLISELNSKSGRNVIHLRYFEDIDQEVDNFFRKAEEIVAGKGFLIDNTAMETIVNDCKNPSDVIEKKQEFYRQLRLLNIQCFCKDDYYNEENFEFNLESEDMIEKYKIEEDKLKYLKHLNYINILRKGKQQGDLSKSKYIVLTETNKILKISKEITNEQSIVPLAINMYILTNRLWYDLNKGFGSSVFPKNFDIITKAKILLSKSLSTAVTYKYEQAKEKLLKNEITNDQMTYTMAELREQMKKPEDINNAILDDVLDDISEKSIMRYVNEKQNLKKELEMNKSKIKEIENKVGNRDHLILKKDDMIRTLKLDKINLLQEKKNDLNIEKSKMEEKNKVIVSKLHKFDLLYRSLSFFIFFAYIIVLGILYHKIDNVIEFYIFIVGLLPVFIVSLINIIKIRKLDFKEFYILLHKWSKSQYQIKIESKIGYNYEELKNIQNAILDIENELSSLINEDIK